MTHTISMSDAAFGPLLDGSQTFLIESTKKGISNGDTLWIKETSEGGPTGRELVCAVSVSTRAGDNGVVVNGFTVTRRIEGAKELAHGKFACPFCQEPAAQSVATESGAKCQCSNCLAKWTVTVEQPPGPSTVPPGP